MALLGYESTGRRWATELEVSGLDAPAETFVLDKTLPALGQDPKFPSDLVVIPRGRLVGVGSKYMTSGTGAATHGNAEDNETVLTLADGATYAPIGFAGYTLYKKYHADKEQWRPAIFKNRLIRLPYVKTTDSFSNAQFGDLVQGDLITAYPGKSTTTTKLDRHVGKVVKWVEKKAYAVSFAAATAAATASLTNATYSPFTPTVVTAFTTAGLAIGANVSLGYNTALGTWLASASAAIGTLIYTYGQGPEMIAGQVLGLELIDSDFPGWLKWVNDNYGAWDLPRRQIPGYTTAATASGTGLTAMGTNEFKIAAITGSRQVAGWKTISVKLGYNATYLGLDGTSNTATAGSWTALPRSTQYPNNDQTYGLNFSINPITGYLQLWGVASSAGAALANTEIVVEYYYTDVQDGQQYDVGQMDLTDGVTSTLGAGTPAAYDIAGSVGIMKVMVN